MCRRQSSLWILSRGSKPQGQLFNSRVASLEGCPTYSERKDSKTSMIRWWLKPKEKNISWSLILVWGYLLLGSLRKSSFQLTFWEKISIQWVFIEAKVLWSSLSSKNLSLILKTRLRKNRFSISIRKFLSVRN